MSAPFGIPHRPFSIDSRTEIMLPDGVFISELGRLKIGINIVNLSEGEVTSGYIRPSPSESEEWHYVGDNQVHLSYVPKGCAKLVVWEADFSRCSIGKKEIRVEYGAQILLPDGSIRGFDGVLTAQIFVASCAVVGNHEGRITVPEGVMSIKFGYSAYLPGRDIPLLPKYYEHPVYSGRNLPIFTRGSSRLVPAPGCEDDIPFQDPWWKVAAAILAIIFFFMSLVKFKETGEAEIGFDIDLENAGPNAEPNSDGGVTYPIDECCDSGGSQSSGSMSEAGMYASMALAMVLVAAKGHSIDPWQRGRNVFPSVRGDVKVLEELKWEYPLPRIIDPNKQIKTQLSWSYRQTLESGTVKEIVVSEQVASDFYAAKVLVNVKSVVTRAEGIYLQVYLEDHFGQPFGLASVYGFVYFISPNGQESFRVNLDGFSMKNKLPLGAGWFEAHLDINNLLEHKELADYLGTWTLKVFGQATNMAVEGMEPFVAATYIGGDVLLSPFVIQLVEPDADIFCPIAHSYTVEVV